MVIFWVIAIILVFLWIAGLRATFVGVKMSDTIAEAIGKFFKAKGPKGVVEQAFRNAYYTPAREITPAWETQQERDAFGITATEAFIKETDEILRQARLGQIRREQEQARAKQAQAKKTQGRTRSQDEASLDLLRDLSNGFGSAMLKQDPVSRKRMGVALVNAIDCHLADYPATPYKMDFETLKIVIGKRIFGVSFDRVHGYL